MALASASHGLQIGQDFPQTGPYQTYDQRLGQVQALEQTSSTLTVPNVKIKSGLRGGHAPAYAASQPPPQNHAQYYAHQQPLPPFVQQPVQNVRDPRLVPVQDTQYGPLHLGGQQENLRNRRVDDLFHPGDNELASRKHDSLERYNEHHHARRVAHRPSGARRPPPSRRPPRLLSAAKAHELHDHIVNLLKGRDFMMVVLALVQHSLLLGLKMVPGHASRLLSRGGKPLNVVKLSAMIDSYRCFNNISSWLGVYQTFRSGHAEHLGKDGMTRLLTWSYHLIYVGYLACEGLNFLGMADVLKISRRGNAMRSAMRCTKIARWSIRFWLATTIITYIKHAREAYLDRKSKRARIEKERRLGHRTRKGSHRDGHKDSTFWKDMREREIKRRRQTAFDAAWFPGALHMCLKKSPLKNDTIVSLSALAGYGSKLKYLWQDSRPPTRR